MNLNYKKTLKIFKEVLFYLFMVLLIISTSLSFYSKLNNRRPSLFGYSSLVVVSDSMEPTLKVKEFLILKEVDFNTLKIDDIVSFKYDIDNDDIEELVTHRVIDINYSGDDINYITTRGDKLTNNVYPPSENVNEEMFEGKIVFNSYYIGATLHFMSVNNIFLILIGGLFLYLIVKQIINISNLIVEEKNKKNKKQI